MKVMDDNLCAETVRWQKKLFSRSVRRQARLRILKELLGATAGQACLEITAGDAVISLGLREGGGVWTTLAIDAEAQAALSFFLSNDPPMLDGLKIDAPDQSFDALVLTDVLERVRDDSAFIRECHRVLKSDGRLVVTTARKRLFCIGSCPLKALLGLSWKARGFERPGYTAQQFFDVLKDGFDVPETVSYSTCCVELPGVLGEALANSIARRPYNMPPLDVATGDFYHYTRIYAIGSVFYPLMWLLSKIDESLLLISPGHNMAAKTKRRVWRSRKQPVLIDGRSIAEAAINTKIGTAAPF